MGSTVKYGSNHRKVTNGQKKNKLPDYTAQPSPRRPRLSSTPKQGNKLHQKTVGLLWKYMRNKDLYKATILALISMKLTMISIIQRIKYLELCLIWFLCGYVGNLITKTRCSHNSQIYLKYVILIPDKVLCWGFINIQDSKQKSEISCQNVFCTRSSSMAQACISWCE